jgi:hypothetical protein
LMRGQLVIEFTQKLFVQARGNAVESYVRLGSLPPGGILKSSTF